MAKKFLTSLGLVSLASDPALGTEGELYYNNVSDGVRLYKNGSWTDLASTGNLPSGGTTGEILAKSSNTDYAVEWIENYADYTEVVKLRVKNDGTRALYKGQPVYVTGADGTNVLVGRSSNVTEGGSSKTIGILAQNLATNGQGFVIKEGKLGTLDTSAAGAVGDPVWLGVDGALIYGLANKPYAPAHLVYLGVVTKKNGSTGEIFVQVQNGFEIRELHDVAIGYSASIQNNEILAYNSASSVWINQTPSESGIVITDDLLDYLTKISASSTYLTQVNASTTYLTQFDADASFQPLNTVLSNISDLELSSGFLISDGVDDWYIDENEYLTTANASSTYLSQEDAAVIYLAQSTAASAYQPIGEYLIGEDLNGYLTESSASVIYQPVGDYLISGDLYGYLTESSASTNYQPLDEDLTQISLLNSSSPSVGFLKTTGPGYWSIDTSEYLTTETDPVFVASDAYGIDSTDISNWDTAYGWGNHTSIGYLTTETDPVFVASDAYGIDSTDISNWDTAYGWGNHASAGYLTTETDPVFVASDAYGIDSTDISNWDTSYGWGNHASAGYALDLHNHTLDSLSNVVITGTPSDRQAIVWDTTTSKWINETVSGGASYPDQSGNDGKFLQTNSGSVSWQNVNFSGYLTESSASTTYLTQSSASSTYQPAGSYLTTESDTLSSVTARGATTSNSITITSASVSSSPTTGALVVTGGIGIGENLYVDNDVYIGGDIHITGSISGSLTYINVTDLVVSDPLIYLAENNQNDMVDIGTFGAYNHSASIKYHTGLIRDASDSGKWKLASNLLDPTSNVIDFTGATFDTLKIGILEVTDASTTRTNIGIGNVENTALSTWSGSSNIITLGTVTTGVWSGTAVGTSKGGTGLTSIGTSNQILRVNSGATGLEWVTLDALPSQSGNNGKYLTTNGSTASWGTLDLSQYLTISSASTTYLTQASASTTYLTQASASTTYLTQASASTAYQPLDSDLTALAGLTSAANALPYFTGSGTASTTTLSSFGRSLIDDADASASRTTLGLGTMAVETASNYLTTSSASTTYATKVSPTLTTPNIGAATGTSLNTTGNIISHIDILTPTFTTNAYTLTAGDDGDLLMLNNSSSSGSLYVPTDASVNFAIGTQITMVQSGTGQITVLATTPGTTTVNSTPGSKLRAQWSSATLVKTAANTWILMGDLSV